MCIIATSCEAKYCCTLPKNQTNVFTALFNKSCFLINVRVKLIKLNYLTKLLYLILQTKQSLASNVIFILYMNIT